MRAICCRRSASSQRSFYGVWGDIRALENASGEAFRETRSGATILVVQKGKGAEPTKTKRRRHMPITRNPMLVLTIWHTVADEKSRPSFEKAVTHVAVHAWYEGHIEGHTIKKRPWLELAKKPDPMPTPPWPDENDPELWTIVEDTLSRFEERLAHGALAFAAGLAWAAGYREGETCAGCSARGPDAAAARSLRAGLVPIHFDPQAKALLTAAVGARRTKNLVGRKR